MLEARLTPIATRKADLNSPNWVETLRAAEPLDEAGIRDQAQDLLEELIAAYATGGADRRAFIRDLFRRFHSFAWRRLFEYRERQPRASGRIFCTCRYAIRALILGTRSSGLDHIVEDGRRAGVDVGPTLREVAAPSSHQAPYSWGSTHEWLMDRLTAR
jgi:hypothetical protein